MILAVMYRGVMAIALTALGVTCFAAVVNSTPNRKYLGYTYREQIGDLLPSVALASVMVVCVYFAGRIPAPAAAGIVIQIAVGVSVYVLLSKLCRVSQFAYLVNVVKSFVRR